MGGKHRLCDTDGCGGDGVKWSHIGNVRLCLCISCDKARRHAPRVAPPPDPIAIAERMRLAAEAAESLARATEASREEAAENERKEAAAQQSRHSRRINSAAPLVHAPLVPRAVKPPKPPKSARPPKINQGERLLLWLNDGHNGATNREALAHMGCTRAAMMGIVRRLRQSEKLSAFDRHNPRHSERLFLPGTAPGYKAVPANRRCGIADCKLEIKARAMCNAHWIQWRAGKLAEPSPRESRICSAEGCEKISRNEMCHYHRYLHARKIMRAKRAATLTKKQG